MKTKYTVLNRFRIKSHLSMSAFAKELGLNIDVVKRTLRGETEPHDYNKEAFDRYYWKHEEKILEVLSADSWGKPHTTEIENAYKNSQSH